MLRQRLGRNPRLHAGVWGLGLRRASGSTVAAGASATASLRGGAGGAALYRPPLGSSSPFGFVVFGL